MSRGASESRSSYERFAVGQAEDASVAAHGFGDEVGGVCLSGGEEGGGMELHELHVLHGAFGAVDHGFAVAGGDDGVGGGLVDGSASSGAHECDFGEVGVYLLRVGVEHVGAVAVDVGCAPGDACAEVVLGNDLYGEVVFLDFDVGAGSDGCHEPALDFSSCVVGVVEYAELGVPAFAVEVEVAVGVLVEVHAPGHELAYLLGGVFHYLLHGLSVADVVAGHHGVFDVFLEVVYFEVGDGGHAALCEAGVGLVECGLADEAHFPFFGFGHFQGVAHAGHAAADDEEVVFANHRCKWFRLSVQR